MILGQKSKRRDQSSFSFLENINFWKSLPRAPEFEYPSLHVLWFKFAPATFMRFVHEVLYSTTPELKNHTEVYLDDILIHTKDLESHQAVFEQICQNLSRYNLAIN